MAVSPDLLIITNREDTTADLVVYRAELRGLNVLRLNTECLGDVDVSWEPGLRCEIGLRGNSKRAMISNSGVWYRRPLPPRDPDWSEAVQEFVNEQWQDCIDALEVVPGLRWLNKPSANRVAENKVAQLVHAQRSGLATPTTLVTNCYDDFTRFRDLHGRVIVKAVAGGLIESSPPGFVYTTEVDESNEPQPDELRASPIVVQKLIDQATHFRATVVGSTVHVARIEQVHALDWRAQPSRPTLVPAELPENVTASLVDLVRGFGLTFSSADLVLSEEEYYFLDLNPNGEWGWLEKGAGLPISTSILRWLCP